IAPYHRAGRESPDPDRASKPNRRPSYLGLCGTRSGRGPKTSSRLWSSLELPRKTVPNHRDPRLQPLEYLKILGDPPGPAVPVCNLTARLKTPDRAISPADPLNLRAAALLD